MLREHVPAYCDYIASALRREGVPVIAVSSNLFDAFAFGVIVKCLGPWDQYDKNTRHGTWLRTIRMGETVQDIIGMYRKAYDN